MTIDFIGKNVASKKNSKQWTGKRLISSKTVRNYEKAMSLVFEENKQRWLQAIKGVTPPYYVVFYFYRDSKRSWDWVNCAQLPLDMFQEYGYIEDDDTKHLIPIYGGEEVVKKDKAGFSIRVLSDEEADKLKKIANIFQKNETFDN